MSMQDDEILTDNEGNAILNPKIREEKRQAEKDRDRLIKENRDLNLRVVFSEVGVPTDGMGKFFREHYSGEVDIESVRSAVREAGIQLGGQSQGESKPTWEQARAAQLEEELARLRSGSTATSDINSDSDLTALKELENRLRAAKSPEEFDDIMASPEAQRLSDRPVNFN